MHRKPKAELIPLDTKLERALRNLKKVRIIEATVMADEREANQNVPVVVIDGERAGPTHLGLGHLGCGLKWVGPVLPTFFLASF